MAFPLTAVTLKSLKFRLCSLYRGRGVVIPQAPPVFQVPTDLSILNH